MAMDFTIKEAKKLIDLHKGLLSKLEKIASKAASMKTEIKKVANDLVIQAALKKKILGDCVSPTNILGRSSDIERLIFSLYKYQKMCTSVETAKGFQTYEAVKIRQSIELLNPGLAGLSWFFGGKRAKESATLAFQELTNILNGYYGQTIPALEVDVNSIDNITRDTAWEEFIENPYSFEDVLGYICSDIFHNKAYNPFQTQLKALANLEEKVRSSQAATDKGKTLVKTSTEKMMAFNAMQILKNVPVEELNREKLGFRVKALRDSGFTTMADIYSASNYHLVSINGISENAAYSMKRIANRFLEDAKDGIKIKLSADERNRYSTELVKSIYVYRLKNASRVELYNTIQSVKAVLGQAKNILNSVESGLPWLFYTEKQRADVRGAYKTIKSVVEGEYAQEIARLTNVLLDEKIAPSADVVWRDFKEHSIEYISVLEDIVPGVLGNDDGLYGLPEDLARGIQEEAFFPEGLLCTLRRYQEWGVKYILHQKKVLLGDEMGLGKTVQAIATMVSLRNTGATHFMVVCPASVVTNWCREIGKHSKLRATKIHGAGRMQALKSWVKTGGVAVTTFETTAYIKDEYIEKNNLLIVDEAHYIKNPEAARSINVKRLCAKSERLLFMTGTALENKVEEMVSLIDILQPSIASSIQNMTFMPNAPQFRKRVAPVYYRRKREDVLTELPELIESKEWCNLNSEEKEIYEQNVLAKNYAACRRLSWDAVDLKKSCKATRLLEIIEQAKGEDRKVLCFSFFLDTIRNIGALLGTRCYGPINGSVPPARRQEIIDEFDKAPAGSVLLAQIQSGGTGLNIQSASIVVICEPQFKPSIENQAISRAYRMGQARNVLVYRLLCANTIDERMTDLLEEKQKIFDAFADKSVAAEQNEANNVEVDEKKFGQLIQEEINRINAEKGIRPTEDEK